MRIASGVTDQYIYFVAVDATDLKTRETGLSSFTVYRSRNGGAAAAMTTPTVNETDATNMPGVYELLLDEDMTIDSGDETQEMVFHITHAGMAPVTRTIELYRPKITAGNTLGVAADGDLLEVNTLTGHTAQTGDSFARIGATGSGLTSLAQASAYTATRAGYLDNINNVALQTTAAQTGDAYARLGAPAGASVSADVAAVKVDTAAILVDTGTTLDAALAVIDANVDAILVDTADMQPKLGTPAGASMSADIAAVKSDTGAILTDTGTTGVLLAATATSAQLVDDVWDEALTGATHNVATSAGRRLRELGAASIRSGTAQGGATNSITLDAGASATDEIYDNNLVVIIGGTGAGQSRIIAEYNGTTKVAIVSRVWETTPDNTSEFQIIADHVADLTSHGVAQGGTSSTITLASSESATDDIYNGQTVFLSTSTGTGQARLITDYNGTTKVATVSPDWQINPTSSTVYKIVPVGQVIVQSLASNALAQVNAEADTALSDYDPPTRAELTTDTNSVLTRLGTPAGASVSADIATVDANVDAALADTNELQTDWANGGRLDLILDARAAEATVAALNDISVADVLAGVIETGYTLKQSLQIIAAATGGKLSGAATATNTIRSLDDSANRIVATVDSDGNRTAVTHNV